MLTLKKLKYLDGPFMLMHDITRAAVGVDVSYTPPIWQTC